MTLDTEDELWEEFVTGVGRKIAKFRLAFGWSRKELSRRTGVHTSTIRTLEDRVRPDGVTLWTIYRLAIALDKQPTDFIPEIDYGY